MNNIEFSNALVGPLKRPFGDRMKEQASNFLTQAGSKIQKSATNAGEYLKELPSSLWGGKYRRGMTRGREQLEKGARLKKDGQTDPRAIRKTKRRGITAIREAQEAGDKTMRDRLIVGGGVGLAGTGIGVGAYAANRKNKNNELAARYDELSELIEFSLVDQSYRTARAIKKAGRSTGNFWDSLMGNQYREARDSAKRLGEKSLQTDATKAGGAQLRARYRNAADIMKRKAAEEGARTMRNRVLVGGGVGLAGTGIGYAASQGGYQNRNRDFAEDYADLSDAFEFHASNAIVDERLIALNDLIDEAIAGNCLGE